MKRALLLIAFLSGPAFAYNEAVHAFITRRALPDDTRVASPTQADLDAFRGLFWRTASAHAEFVHRFPTPDSFSAWEFKEFLMLDPAARVFFMEALQDARASNEPRSAEFSQRVPVARMPIGMLCGLGWVWSFMSLLLRRYRAPLNVASPADRYEATDHVPASPARRVEYHVMLARAAFGASGTSRRQPDPR